MKLTIGGKQIALPRDARISIQRSSPALNDLITKNEIGVNLKSGYTVFRSKMSGKKLGGIDFGSESWLPLKYTSQQVTTKLSEWDLANTSGNQKYCVSPIAINDCLYTTTVDEHVNKIDKLTGNLKYDTGGTRQNLNLYMLQFLASFMIDKIFESAWVYSSFQ